MSNFSKGLLSTTTQGLSDSADLAAGMDGHLDGDGWATAFLLVLGVVSLFWTRWGKRSLRISSRSSSTICRQRSVGNKINTCTTCNQSTDTDDSADSWHLVPCVGRCSDREAKTQDHTGRLGDETDQVEGHGCLIRRAVGTPCGQIQLCFLQINSEFSSPNGTI